VVPGTPSVTLMVQALASAVPPPVCHPRTENPGSATWLSYCFMCLLHSDGRLRGGARWPASPTL